MRNLILLPALMIFLAASSYAQPFKISAVSDVVQVFEDGYQLPLMNDSVRLFGIRGEVISGQFVISTKANLTDVTVEISEIRNSGGGVIPGTDVEWNFVGTIPLSKNSPNQPLTVVTRKAPASFPDYLMEERKLNLTKGMHKSVWLTISIPESAGAGTYLGIARVRSSQGEQSIPLSVEVYPLTLPVERHLKITEWYSTRNFSKFYGIQEEYSPEWFGMLKKYADNMTAHRQNIFQVPMNSIIIKKTSSGNLTFDFSRFDQIADVFWNTGKMDYLETGELAKFEKDWYGTKIVLKDFQVLNESGEKSTIPGTEVIPYLLPAFEGHLRQKGWLDKTYFHVKDEPTLVNALSWREISAYMHHYAPDLIRVDAIETTHLFGEIEVAIPKIDYLGANFDIYKKAQQEGAELWYYTVGIYQGNTYLNKTIDMPVIESRLMHWLNYKYDLTGYLHWGWNQWTDDPFQEVGQHIGDGWHVYPSKDGVLNSLRWEQMRNGIQDYEYMWMLENRIKLLKDSLGSRFHWIDPKARGKEIAGRVIMELDEHTQDAEVMYNAKKVILKEILDMDISPRLYVQTLPGENSAVKANEYLTEVFGWAEPGTSIVINRQPVPVDKSGLFMKNVSLTPLRNTVTVECSGNGVTKVIERKFVVE